MHANTLPIIHSASYAFRPPRRVTVAEGAAESLMIRQTGGYSGPWSADETPYMIEPMNMLASRQHESVCFVGPARTGKCLDVATPIPTPTGWTTMGELVAGDTVFGPDGLPTAVLAAHDVKHGLPCYEVAFSDGSTIVADSEHLWGGDFYNTAENKWVYVVLSTVQVLSVINRGSQFRVCNSKPLGEKFAEVLNSDFALLTGFREITLIAKVRTRPVRCIQVANDSHLFLAGRGMVPTHNTMGLLDGWLARNITCDPGDMLIVQMSQEKAREYSKTRVDRAIRNSPRLADLMSTRGHDDNTHDKLFKHGMWVKIGWPSATQLSSSDYRYVALTDYDRMPDNIDEEGPAYALGLKRTTTFLSRGMCMVESSPGRDYTDPYWEPETPHEAPPATGIIGIYNRSDRRRWYWQCPDCHEYFEAAPGLKLFSTLPPENELMDMVRSANLPDMAEHHARVVCPHCGGTIEQKHKPHMNRIETARWVADGQTVDRDGVVSGEYPRSSIAGYWLGGVAATYQKWDSLILRYLQGLRELALSGSDLSLKTTINTDQGAPYMPRHLIADKDSSAQDRVEDLERYMVPDEARFLIATADVQGGQNGRFVCEVRAWGGDARSWLVDRFAIWATERDGVTAKVDPAGYPEDWELLTKRLVLATYKTSAGKELRVLRTGVDTGGEDGVTHNAYAWLRSLRRVGLSSRVMLLKGGSHQDERPMFKGAAKLNNGKAMKDMPVWILNTNYFKDLVAASLRRKTPGPGYFHVPRWLPDTYFDELRAEVRDPNGKWRKIKPRNEALDLWVYSLAILESLGYGPKGRLSWTDPPAWAAPLLMGNSELITPEERKAEHEAFSNVAKRVQSAAPAKAAPATTAKKINPFTGKADADW